MLACICFALVSFAFGIAMANHLGIILTLRVDASYRDDLSAITNQNIDLSVITTQNIKSVLGCEHREIVSLGDIDTDTSCAGCRWVGI